MLSQSAFTLLAALDSVSMVSEMQVKNAVQTTQFYKMPTKKNTATLDPKRTCRKDIFSSFIMFGHIKDPFLFFINGKSGERKFHFNIKEYPQYHHVLNTQKAKHMYWKYFSIRLEVKDTSIPDSVIHSVNLGNLLWFNELQFPN